MKLPLLLASLLAISPASAQTPSEIDLYQADPRCPSNWMCVPIRKSSPPSGMHCFNGGCTWDDDGSAVTSLPHSPVVHDAMPNISGDCINGKCYLYEAPSACPAPSAAFAAAVEACKRHRRSFAYFSEWQDQCAALDAAHDANEACALAEQDARDRATVDRALKELGK